MKTVVVNKSKTGYTKQYAYENPINFCSKDNIKSLITYVNA